MRGQSCLLDWVRYAVKGKLVKGDGIGLDGKCLRTLLASGNIDGTVYLQKLDDTTNSTVLGKHSSWVESLAFSPQGNYLVSASDASKGGERTLELWNLSQQPAEATRFPLTKESQTIFDVTFSHDGKFLATAGADTTAQLWNVNKLDKPVAIFSGHGDIVTDVSLSPDSKFLATASFDGLMRVWEITKPGEPFKILAGHENGVRTVVFSPDGTLLASAGQDSTIKLWSTKTWKLVTTLGVGSRVWAITFSPDSTLLASSNEDGTLGLWQKDSEELELLRGHSDTAWSVSFSKDGKWLVSASEDRTIRFWPASITDVRQFSCQKAGRNLSQAEWQDMFGTMTYHATCPEFSQ